jgi:FkbM family methyltransferase
MRLISRALHKIANKLYPNDKFVSSKNMRIIPWLLSDGDNTHRLNYKLDSDSLVFDVGGYLGNWSKLIFEKYNCYIHIFEPVNEYFNTIKENLSNHKITINQFGLAERSYKTEITLNNEASSIYKKGNHTSIIQLINFMEYIDKNKIEKIDLMKINIEGGEYDLLEYILKKNYINNIVNLQIQFHDISPNSEKRMKNIQQILSKTHELTYYYYFIWENWKMK